MSPVTTSPLTDLLATYTHSIARLLMLHTNRGKLVCKRAYILDIWFLCVLILLKNQSKAMFCSLHVPMRLAFLCAASHTVHPGLYQLMCFTGGHNSKGAAGQETTLIPLVTAFCVRWASPAQLVGKWVFQAIKVYWKCQPEWPLSNQSMN